MPFALRSLSYGGDSHASPPANRAGSDCFCDWRVAAASLLPYVPTMQRVHHAALCGRNRLLLRLWAKAAETLGSPLPFGGWLWLTLLTAALVIGLWALLRKPTTTRGIANSDRLLFALIALLLGTICYAGFLRVLSYSTRPWYFVTFVAFAATCIEMIFSSVERKEKTLLARSVCALLLMAVSFVPALGGLEGRQTNADIIAAKLARTATQDDLIVINHSFMGLPSAATITGSRPM